MQDFKKLDVWSKSFDFCSDIYRITANFPAEEKFGITNQIRRAAASIGANIAEGCGRHSAKELIQFLFNAYGSTKECEHFLLMSRKLNYLADAEFSEVILKIEEISKMLNGFITTAKLKNDVRLTTANSKLRTRNGRSNC